MTQQLLVTKQFNVMPLWDKISGTIKGAARNIQDSIQEKRELKETKEKILERFSVPQLKQICKLHIGKEPPPYEVNPITGEKRKRELTRSVYIRYIETRVSLEVLEDYAQKFKISLSKILKEGDEDISNTFQPAVTRSNQLDNINDAPQANEEANVLNSPENGDKEFETYLNLIKREYEPGRMPRDEKEFEGQLAGQLKHIFKGRRVETQVGLPGGKVDVVLFGKYAIELKVAENPAILRDLIGQLLVYKRSYDHVGVIILDKGKVGREIIESWTNEYLKMGCPSVVIRA